MSLPIPIPLASSAAAPIGAVGGGLPDGEPLWSLLAASFAVAALAPASLFVRRGREGKVTFAGTAAAVIGYLLLGYGLHRTPSEFGLVAAPGPISLSSAVWTTLADVLGVALTGALLVLAVGRCRTAVAIAIGAAVGIVLVPTVGHWTAAGTMPGWLTKLGFETPSTLSLMFAACGAVALLFSRLAAASARLSAGRLSLFAVGLSGWIAVAAIGSGHTLSAATLSSVAVSIAFAAVGMAAVRGRRDGLLRSALLGTACGLTIGLAGPDVVPAVVASALTIAVVALLLRGRPISLPLAIGVAAAVSVSLTAKNAVAIQLLGLGIAVFWGLGLAILATIFSVDDTTSERSSASPDRPYDEQNVRQKTTATVAASGVDKAGSERVWTSERQRLEEQIAALGVELQTRTDELTASQSERDELKTRLRDATANTQAQAAAIRDLKSAAQSEAADAIAQAEQARDDAEQDRDAAIADFEQAKAEVETLRSEQSGQDEHTVAEIAALTEELQSARSEMEERRRDCDRLAADVTAANDKCEIARLKADSLAEELATSRDETAAAVGERDAALAAADAERRELNGRIDGLAAELEDSQASGKSLKMELETVREKLTLASSSSDVATQEICDQQKAQIQRLMRDLAAAKEAAADPTEQLDQLAAARDEVDRKAARIRVLEGELERAKQSQAAAAAAASGFETMPSDASETEPLASVDPSAAVSDHSPSAIDSDALLELCMNDVDLTLALLAQLNDDLPTGTKRFEQAVAEGDSGAAATAIAAVRAFTDQLPLVPLGTVVAESEAAVRDADCATAETLLPRLQRRVDETLAEAERLIGELRSR